MILTATGYQLPEVLKGTILEQILEVKLREIEGAKQKLPAVSLGGALERAEPVRSLKKALLARSPAIIAEIKKASPSAGILRKDFNPTQIAREYEKNGAAAISVVTEVHHFRGNLEDLACLRWAVRVPLVRKDFIVDPYQIVEARIAGADAVLLIASLLDTISLGKLRQETEALGMEALVEIHDETELARALEAGAALVGVNNRDLRTFETSLEVSLRLAPRLPKAVVSVAESGIKGADDILRLRKAGYRGFLIGEELMRAPSPGEALSGLLSACARAEKKAS